MWTNKFHVNLSKLVQCTSLPKKPSQKIFSQQHDVGVYLNGNQTKKSAKQNLRESS